MFQGSQPLEPGQSLRDLSGRSDLIFRTDGVHLNDAKHGSCANLARAFVGGVVIVLDDRAREAFEAALAKRSAK
jgi:hypothetical protein